LLETVNDRVVDTIQITLSSTLTGQATTAARQVAGATGAAQASRYADLILGGGTSSTASWLQSKMVIEDILNTWRRGGVSQASAVLKVASGALFTAPKTRADIGRGILTGSISCNKNSPVSAVANFPVEVVVGPEFVTGSTRMKSGTAQKLVLNMISTAVMIQLGRVEDNKMVNMQLTNDKLIDRGVKMLMEKVKLISYEEAKTLLLKEGSVKNAIKSIS
jgi:N-acetylmuramic acid 6-phosphate (MurNAc-6-P) etherase